MAQTMDLGLMAAATRGPQVEDLGTAWARAQAIQAQRAQQAQQLELGRQQMQLGVQKLQEGQFEAQARDRDLKDQNLIQELYRDAGGDIDKTISAAAAKGVSPKGIMALQTHALTLRKTTADLGKVELDNLEKGHDALRGELKSFMGQPPEAKAAGWNPWITRHVASGRLSPQEGQQLLAQYPEYPGDDQMKVYDLGLATGSQLAKEEKERREVAAREKTADTGRRRLELETPGINSQNLTRGLAIAGQTVDQVANQDQYTAWRAGLPADVQKTIPTMFSPAAVALVRRQALTVEQATQADQAKLNAENTEADRKVTQGQGAQRIAISGAELGLRNKEYQQKYGDALGQMSPNNKAIAEKLAAGDFNPAQLGRMPGKESIIAGAIQINPNWTPFIFDTKKSFTDPEKTQAKNLGTISRIVGHIGRFEQNSQQMGTAPLYAAGMNLTGQQNQVNEDAHAIAAELEKLVSGGVGSEGQTQAWQKALHSPSAGARQKAVDEISQLIGSQYEGMNQTYKSAIGSDLPIDKYVTPAGRQWMKSKGINVTGALEPAAAPAAGGKIRARDPQGVLHEAAAGTALPAGWKVE